MTAIKSSAGVCRFIVATPFIPKRIPLSHLPLVHMGPNRKCFEWIRYTCLQMVRKLQTYAEKVTARFALTHWYKEWVGVFTPTVLSKVGNYEYGSNLTGIAIGNSYLVLKVFNDVWESKYWLHLYCYFFLIL